MGKLNAKVIVAKCNQHNKMFGVRVEKDADGDWIMTWAFPLSADRASAESYGRETIDGSLCSSSSYNGCPYCGQKALYKCSKCGTLNCHSHGTKNVKCVNCGNEGTIGGTIDSFTIDSDI